MGAGGTSKQCGRVQTFHRHVWMDRLQTLQVVVMQSVVCMI